MQPTQTAPPPTGQQTTTAMHLRIADVGAEPARFLSPISGVFRTPDCTLVETVKALGETPGDFVDDAEFALMAVRNDGVPAGVSVDQAAAVRLYTFQKNYAPSLYTLLNTALRAEDRRLCLPYFGYIKLLLTALKVTLRAAFCVRTRVGEADGMFGDSFFVRLSTSPYA